MKTSIYIIMTAGVLFLSTGMLRADPNSDLISAASFGPLFKVEAAHKAGADINFRAQPYSVTALMLASSSEGTEDVVRYLIDKGADLNAQCDSGWTALMRAADGGHPGHVEALIKAGAGVNLKTKKGYTALGMAEARLKNFPRGDARWDEKKGRYAKIVNLLKKAGGKKGKRYPLKKV